MLAYFKFDEADMTEVHLASFKAARIFSRFDRFRYRSFTMSVDERICYTRRLHWGFDRIEQWIRHASKKSKSKSKSGFYHIQTLALFKLVQSKITVSVFHPRPWLSLLPKIPAPLKFENWQILLNLSLKSRFFEFL